MRTKRAVTVQNNGVTEALNAGSDYTISGQMLTLKKSALERYRKGRYGCRIQRRSGGRHGVCPRVIDAVKRNTLLTRNLSQGLLFALSLTLPEAGVREATPAAVASSGIDIQHGRSASAVVRLLGVDIYGNGEHPFAVCLAFQMHCLLGG